MWIIPQWGYLDKIRYTHAQILLEYVGIKRNKKYKDCQMLR